MQTDERPRFLVLRQSSGLTSQQVAQEAGLPLSDEYRAEIGCVVETDVVKEQLLSWPIPELSELACLAWRRLF